MRIFCNNCGAVYLIAEKIIGSKGRIVKCAKCSYCWTVNPVESSIPLQTKKCFTERFLHCLFGCLVFINLITIILLASNFLAKDLFLKKFYSFFNISANQELALENFTAKKINNSLIISGKLTNLSKEEKSFPYIRYTILDHSGEILMRLTTPASDKIIKPNESLQIGSKISNIEANYEVLQIDIGNKIDLILR